MPKGIYQHKKGRVITWGDKISKVLAGRRLTDKHRTALSMSHKGQVNVNKGKVGLFTHTEDAKRRIGVASLGNTYMIGKKLSDESKNKIADKSKGRQHTNETKEKLRNFFLGRPRFNMRGDLNPMFTHVNSYKSKFGKTGFRKDLGIFVRSSWEANMLRIFKFLGLTVEYEPQSFKLLDGGSYRPDFYIHDTEELIEVKGYWQDGAKEKFLKFKNEYPDLPIEVIDSEKYHQYLNEFSNLIGLEV